MKKKIEAKEITKVEALAKFLEVDPTDISETSCGEFDAPGGSYLVLTDSEADEKAKEYILDSLWAFNYNFLTGHSKAIRAIPQKDYEAMAGKLCESFNEAVKAMIDDLDHFIYDAISADGRGHFLSGYDGNENEEGEYFIYRTN